MAELQAELNRRVQALCERQRCIEVLDQKIVDLVDEQKSICEELKEESTLDDLKNRLSQRTEDEMKKLEEKKQG